VRRARVFIRAALAEFPREKASYLSLARLELFLAIAALPTTF